VLKTCYLANGPELPLDNSKIQSERMAAFGNFDAGYKCP
jgi:hypothetical protein